MAAPKKSWTIRLDREIRQQLKRYGKRHGWNQTALTERALAFCLNLKPDAWLYRK